MQITNVFNMFDAHELNLPQLKVIFEQSDHELPVLCLNNDLSERSIVYSQAEADEAAADGDADQVLLVNEQTIEKGYVFVAQAYRGEGVYNAVLKVGGKWWDCDVVSEGAAYEVNFTDEEVEKLVNDYIAADLAGDAEE